MIIVIGVIVVIASVIGGFLMEEGNVLNLLHPSELVIIGGAAFGAMIIMAPKRVLLDIFKQVERDHLVSASEFNDLKDLAATAATLTQHSQELHECSWVLRNFLDHLSAAFLLSQSLEETLKHLRILLHHGSEILWHASSFSHIIIIS